MSDILNSVQNTSYTAKDFQSIFPELLDLVKQLTNKWDASMSNESDPGVILLKLDALIADKLNYAIDKNTLECFPLSVTQMRNARQLYEQLGYHMHWYQSAATEVSLKWISEDISDAYVSIPAFTMVSDSETHIIYTLLGTAPSVTSTPNVASQNLYMTGQPLTFYAIQGVSLDYDINGNTLITSADLDSNNRLYFNTQSVAQNGIFITNAGENNYAEWELKDNLLVENLGNYYYSFGISQDSSTCYIEFPEDAESIIKDGINITYIRTDGAEGNITANALTKFYADVALTDSNGNSITLTTDNVKIANYSSATNGKDPETLNEAYKNYKRIAGTFSTLVTLRDYINYILTNKLASNGFATDRISDPQSSYSIMCSINGISTMQTQIDKNEITVYDTNNKPVKIYDNSLTAYSLKLYLLEYTTDFTSIDGYDQSFTPMNNAKKQIVEAFIENQKSVSHDYANILTPNSSRSNAFMFINEYPITCRVITKSQLTENQAEELTKTIQTALFSGLNSQEIDFGETITLELLTDIIVDSDERIKSVSIDNLSFRTYAVYADNDASGSDIKFKQIDITDASDDTVEATIKYNTSYNYAQRLYAAGDYCLYPPLSSFNTETHRYICNTAISRVEPFNTNKWDLADVNVAINDDTEHWTKIIGYGNYPTVKVSWDNGAQRYVQDYSQDVSLEQLGIDITCDNSAADTHTGIGSILIRTKLSEQIRDEVYAKCVLCGVTPLFQKDEPVEYKWNQTDNWSSQDDIVYKVDNDGNETATTLGSAYIDNVYEIAANSEITIDSNNSEYLLRNNEYLQLFYPNLIDARTYSNYVKFEYQLNSKVNKDEEYELEDDEFIAFYWKSDGDSNDYYSYYVYSKGNIIKPNVELPLFTGTHTAAFNELILNDASTTYGAFRNISKNTGEILVKDSVNNGMLSTAHNDVITALTKSTNVLSGTKKIVIRKVNKVELNNSYVCYWITNLTDDFGNYKLSFVDNQVTLDIGEYFLYSTSSLNDLVVLGAGTTIEFSDLADTTIDYLTVPPIDLEQVLNDGVKSVSQQGAWYVLSDGTTLTAIENKYNTYNSGTTIRLQPKDSSIADWSVVFNKNAGQVKVTPDTLSLSDFNISYKKIDEDEFTAISTINLSSTKALKARSLLTFNTASDTEQVLLSGQSIDLYVKDTDYILRIKGKDLVSNKTKRYYPVAIASTSAISFDGAGFKHISYYDSGITTYPSIYVMSKNISDSDSTVRFSTQGDVAIHYNIEDNVESFDIKLPIGNYIIKYSQSSKSITQAVKVQAKAKGDTSWTTLKTMYDSNLADENNTFLNLSITKNKVYTIKITLPTHTDEVTVTLENPFKYIKPDNITDDYYAKIQALVRQYDINSAFDYTYNVKENEKISEPLNPMSFLQDNHPFHNFTICKLKTTSDSKIYIMNKK